MKKNYLSPEVDVTRVKLEEVFLASNLDLTTTTVNDYFWDED